MPPLSILIWLPALCGVVGAIIPSLLKVGARTTETSAETGAASADEPGASGSAWSTSGILALIGSVVALGLSIGYIADFINTNRPQTRKRNLGGYVAELSSKRLLQLLLHFGKTLTTDKHGTDFWETDSPFAIYRAEQSLRNATP